MLNAKLNINGIDIQLYGDKDDIIYALKNAQSLSTPQKSSWYQLNGSDTRSVDSLLSGPPINSPKPTEKQARFTKEQLLKIYTHLQNKGNYLINQFSIVRGGKDNPQSYTVCLVFNVDQQRYSHYNPKGQDTFKNTFTVQEAIDNLKNNVEGFSLLHQVADSLWKNVEATEAFQNIISSTETTEAFQNISQPETVSFKDYDQTSPQIPSQTERLNFSTGKPKVKSFISKQIKVGETFHSDDVNTYIRSKFSINRAISKRILTSLMADGIIKLVHNPGTTRSKTWERVV